jgi:hypothetical protein
VSIDSGLYLQPMYSNTGALLVVSEESYFLLIDIIVQIASLIRLLYNVDVVPAFSKVVIRELAQPDGTEIYYE